MKKLMMYGLLLGSLLAIQACSKEEGPVGPKGDKGDTGAAGQNGISGAKAFVFTNQLNGMTLPINIDSTFVDSCVTLVYFQDAANLPSIYWYQAPGFGSAALYQVRYYLNVVNAISSNVSLLQYAPDGSTYMGNATTFSVVKVVFVPITLYGKKAPVDYSDYKATMKYYGLPE